MVHLFNDWNNGCLFLNNDETAPSSIRAEGTINYFWKQDFCEAQIFLHSFIPAEIKLCVYTEDSSVQKIMNTVHVCYLLKQSYVKGKWKCAVL